MNLPTNVVVKMATRSDQNFTDAKNLMSFVARKIDRTLDTTKCGYKVVSAYHLPLCHGRRYHLMTGKDRNGSRREAYRFAAAGAIALICYITYIRRRRHLLVSFEASFRCDWSELKLCMKKGYIGLMAAHQTVKTITHS